MRFVVLLKFIVLHFPTFGAFGSVKCDVRNYLEHVAGTIVEWTQQEEAKHQAALLAAEVEEIHSTKKSKTEESSGKKKEGSKTPKPSTG